MKQTIRVFTQESAIALLNVAVTARDIVRPEIDDIGFVAGVLVFNEEPELLVKFIGRMEQCNAEEFYRRFRVIPEDR